MDKVLYVPARGQRIVMPGRQADWPQDGQPIKPIDAYQARLVRDGDLVPRDGCAGAPPVASDPPAIEDDPLAVKQPIDADKITAGKITTKSKKTAEGGE